MADPDPHPLFDCQKHPDPEPPLKLQIVTKVVSDWLFEKTNGFKTSIAKVSYGMCVFKIILVTYFRKKWQDLDLKLCVRVSHGLLFNMPASHWLFHFMPSHSRKRSMAEMWVSTAPWRGNDRVRIRFFSKWGDRQGWGPLASNLLSSAYSAGMDQLRGQGGHARLSFSMFTQRK